MCRVEAQWVSEVLTPLKGTHLSALYKPVGEEGRKEKKQEKTESPLTKQRFFFLLNVPLMYAAVKGGSETRNSLTSFEI